MMFRRSARSVLSFICCGLISNDIPETEEKRPLIHNDEVIDVYRNSCENKDFDCRLSPVSPTEDKYTTVGTYKKSTGVGTTAFPEITSQRNATQIVPCCEESTEREANIEKCRIQLRNKLRNKGVVKRAKSLPSNTSVGSQKPTISNHGLGDEKPEPPRQDSGDATEWRSPLSHHVLRNLATPHDSADNMVNVPLWKQLDSLIMDCRPPKY